MFTKIKMQQGDNLLYLINEDDVNDNHIYPYTRTWKRYMKNINSKQYQLTMAIHNDNQNKKHCMICGDDEDDAEISLYRNNIHPLLYFLCDTCKTIQNSM